jgi:ABC-2 type transport system ATP-binding protein
MKKIVALSVKNLTKVFQSGSILPWKEKEKPFVAVDHISFDLEQGQILGLLGPNGAGKTTTIQMLLSVLSSSEGSISYFGKELQEHRSDVLKDVAFASTYINLPWRLTVYENLDVYGRLYGLSAGDRRARIERFLKFFGVWELRDKERSHLSAGQSTRLMLAKAFLAYPKVALLDEPTASLDPDIAHEVREFVQEQRKEHNVSILFTSHNMEEVSAVCDKVMFLKKGKIVANDTPANLAKSIRKTKVELMVGDGLKRTIEYAQKNTLSYEVNERWIGIDVDEHQIAEFLRDLATAGVEYSQISINKPTLEDYFLQVHKEH